MGKLGCVLLKPSPQVAADALRMQLHDLRGVLGPEPPIDVSWKGEPITDLPPGVRLLGRASGARALAGAAARVAASSGHLLVLLGSVLPDSAAVQGMLEAFDLDPLVGFAQPRFGDAACSGIWSLPGDAGASPSLFPRAILSLAPEHYLTTERLSACLAIRRDAVVGFAAATDSEEELPATLLHELCLARRRGFRNVVLNRVVVNSGEAHSALYPSVDAASRALLESRFPEMATAEEWFTQGTPQRFEPVAAQARRLHAGAPLPVLLDCRGALDHHNGTSQAILGLLAGLEEEAPSWKVDLLFGAEAASYHGVRRSHPAMRVITSMPDATYAVAVRLNQPWHLATVAELHRRACSVSFNILDTISWDVVYLGNRDIETAWRFVAEHADGLLYDSAFSQHRFGFRFPVSPRIVQTVTHYSVDVTEQTSYGGPAGEEEHLLVFGNDYEHKAVAPAIDLLCRAFPYQRIVAVGSRAKPRHNVTVLPSGKLPAEEIERLTATARVVVYPSFYEGFGFPVVKALAYGRTVVVRASPLWHEIAGITRGPGRLVEFAAPHELVDAVGRVLAGDPVQSLPSGGSLSGEPPRWRDCARAMVDHVERIAASFEPGRWLAREQALSLAHV